jgi:flagellar protein FlaG
MSSEIGNIAAGGAGVAVMRPRTSAPITPHPSESAPARADLAPKVTVPKPVAIQFNEAEERQNLKEAVNLLNQQMSATNRGLGFRMDDVLDTPVVTVRSDQTGEVIRQIPNEVVVHVAHNLEKVKGMFFNGKA